MEVTGSNPIGALIFFLRLLLSNCVILNSYWMRFCDIQNNQGGGKGYQPKPKAEADNPYRDLDYSGYHKN